MNVCNYPSVRISVLTVELVYVSVAIRSEFQVLSLPGSLPVRRQVQAPFLSKLGTRPWLALAHGQFDVKIQKTEKRSHSRIPTGVTPLANLGCFLWGLAWKKLFPAVMHFNSLSSYLIRVFVFICLFCFVCLICCFCQSRACAVGGLIRCDERHPVITPFPPGPIILSLSLPSATSTKFQGVGGGEGVHQQEFRLGDSADSTEPWPCSKHEDLNFATLSNGKCCNVFTLFKTEPSITVFKTVETVRKFAFHTSQWRHAKSGKIMCLKGEVRSTEIFRRRPSV